MTSAEAGPASDVGAVALDGDAVSEAAFRLRRFGLGSSSADSISGVSSFIAACPSPRARGIAA